MSKLRISRSRKMKSKWTSILLIIFILIFLFTGCKSKSKPQDLPTNETNTVIQPTENELPVDLQQSDNSLPNDTTLQVTPTEDQNQSSNPTNNSKSDNNLANKDSTITKDNLLIKNGVLVKYTGKRYIDYTIKLPEEVKEIGERAFAFGEDEMYDDRMATGKRISLCIPKDVILRPYAFQDAIPMDITFEEGRSKIEDYAFYDAGVFVEGNMSITLPKSIRVLGDYSFTCTLGDYQLILNDEIEAIGEGALAGTNCSIPSHVKRIGKGAFGDYWMDPKWRNYPDCILHLPEQLEVIEDNAFEIECPEGYIYIPTSVKSIGEGAFGFGDCAYASGFYVDEQNPYFKSEAGWLYSYDKKRLLYAYVAEGDLKIPEGVEYVGDGSLNTDLNGEGGLQEIYLPTTLKQMNTNAVYWDNIHFQGIQPPKFIGDSSDFEDSMSISGKIHTKKIYVPKGTKQAYIDALQVKPENQNMVVEEE